jgi:hypothetical protein
MLVLLLETLRVKPKRRSVEKVLVLEKFRFLNQPNGNKIIAGPSASLPRRKRRRIEDEHEDEDERAKNSEP